MGADQGVDQRRRADVVERPLGQQHPDEQVGPDGAAVGDDTPGRRFGVLPAHPRRTVERLGRVARPHRQQRGHTGPGRLSGAGDDEQLVPGRQLPHRVDRRRAGHQCERGDVGLEIRVGVHGRGGRRADVADHELHRVAAVDAAECVDRRPVGLDTGQQRAVRRRVGSRQIGDHPEPEDRRVEPGGACRRLDARHRHDEGLCVVGGGLAARRGEHADRHHEGDDSTTRRSSFHGRQ